MTDLMIGGETFRVEVDGDATRPALMLSHALGTDLTMWDGQMPALTKQFRVIRYDSRGHGGSVGGAGPTSIAQLGRDALAILDSLEIEKVHWVGLSMGGAVGLWLLANAPDRIERAVLANTAPRLGTPDVWNARIVSVLDAGMADNAEATLERWFSADFTGRAPQAIAAIRELLHTTTPQGYATCCAALRDMDLRESLGRITHDVLVVAGRDDPAVPNADMSAFVAALGARHVTLEARHLSNIEAEADFNAAVVSFLTTKLAPRTKPAKPVPRKARKTAPAKVAPAKRGSASRRSNAARSPLKKTPPKRAAPKKTNVRSPALKKPASSRRRPTTKVVAKTSPAKTSPAKTSLAKTSLAKTSLAKTAKIKTPPVKNQPAKAPAKKAVVKKAAAKKTAATLRRPTPPTARVAVKAVAKKAKPGKPATKASKATKKTAAKSPAKKLPAPRRKPATSTKPRRPTGRRKP